MADTKRLTLDVGPDFDRVLTETAKAKATTKAEIIRRAVASYVYLNKQTSEGKNVSITNGESIEKVVMLP